MVPETGIEPVRPLFTKRRILSPMCLPISPLGHGSIVKQKSPAHENCGACLSIFEPVSGGATQSRTGLDGFAIRCITDLLSRQNLDKKGKRQLPFSNIWSGKRVSNSRPQPWQGCALPTELFPQGCENLSTSHKKTGAGKESRTLDLNLGKVALYQLSYSRVASPLV